VRALRKQAAANPRLSVGILLCVTRENQHALADHMTELVRELAPDNVTINLARGPRSIPPSSRSMSRATRRSSPASRS